MVEAGTDLALNGQLGVKVVFLVHDEQYQSFPTSLLTSSSDKSTQSV